MVDIYLSIDLFFFLFIYQNLILSFSVHRRSDANICFQAAFLTLLPEACPTLSNCYCFFFFLLAKEHNETKMVLEYALINQRTTFHVIFGLFHRSRNCSNRNIINAAFYRMFTM